MVKVEWTDKCLEDIDGIAEYIAFDSIHYAKIQVQKFFDLEKKLQLNPYIGKKVPELNLDYIREILEGNYRIIYRLVSDSQIDILTIHHRSRLLKNNPFL